MKKRSDIKIDYLFTPSLAIFVVEGKDIVFTSKDSTSVYSTRKKLIARDS